MTTPKLYADRDTLGHTDAEVEAMIRQATADLHQRLEAALQCVGTLRGDIDGLTRKLEEACAAEQRAAIRAGEWMQRVDEARRQVATAREAAFVEAIDLARAARDRALLAMLGAKNSHMRFAEGATHTSLDALVGELARAMHVGAGGEEG